MILFHTEIKCCLAELRFPRLGAVASGTVPLAPSTLAQERAGSLAGWPRDGGLWEQLWGLAVIRGTAHLSALLLFGGTAWALELRYTSVLSYPQLLISSCSTEAPRSFSCHSLRPVQDSGAVTDYELSKELKGYPLSSCKPVRGRFLVAHLSAPSGINSLTWVLLRGTLWVGLAVPSHVVQGATDVFLLSSWSYILYGCHLNDGEGTRARLGWLGLLGLCGHPLETMLGFLPRQQS